MKKAKYLICFLLLVLLVSGCSKNNQNKNWADETDSNVTTKSFSEPSIATTQEESKIKQSEEKIQWNDSWEFANYSVIHSDSVTKYYSKSKKRNDIVVCINAGHGTKGGSSVYTFCHPDKTPKVTGGSTKKGEIKATSINEGTTLLSGHSEAEANLELSLILKDILLESGYDVLMIRESQDVQLDNIARAVFANNNSDCHISLHYDSTTTDKGLFYVGVPNVNTYKKMYPVNNTWEHSDLLGQSIIKSCKEQKIKIYGDGCIPLDLTQTSYSTIPSICVEVGDRNSDISSDSQAKIANGIATGIDAFFKSK